MAFLLTFITYLPNSFSDMDKAKVLEIIEPYSEVLDGQVELVSSFETHKIKTDSLDDADEMFPDKEV